MTGADVVKRPLLSMFTSPVGWWVRACPSHSCVVIHRWRFPARERSQ